MGRLIVVLTLAGEPFALGMRQMVASGITCERPGRLL
jgi:hypothetical protein